MLWLDNTDADAVQCLKGAIVKFSVLVNVAQDYLEGLLHSIWVTFISQFLVVVVVVKAKVRVVVSVAVFPMSM